MQAQAGLFALDDHPNLLPHNGAVYYYGPVMDGPVADYYLERLKTSVDWKNDELTIQGKRIVTARKVAWVGDAQFSYRYSGTTKTATPWTPELLALKERIEAKLNVEFNSCLLNLYHHGGEGMSWHSDDESALGTHTTIASLSLGAQRKFCFRHKVSAEVRSLNLEHGSLLVMQGETQHFWQHSLPKMLRVQEARMNLTFRTFKAQEAR